MGGPEPAAAAQQPRRIGHPPLLRPSWSAGLGRAPAESRPRHVPSRVALGTSLGTSREPPRRRRQTADCAGPRALGPECRSTELQAGPALQPGPESESISEPTGGASGGFGPGRGEPGAGPGRLRTVPPCLYEYPGRGSESSSGNGQTESAQRRRRGCPSRPAGGPRPHPHPRAPRAGAARFFFGSALGEEGVAPSCPSFVVSCLCPSASPQEAKHRPVIVLRKRSWCDRVG